MYDMSRVNANGYFDTHDNTDAHGKERSCGNPNGRFHAPLSETRRRNHPCSSHNYYAYLGRVYAFAGCIADVGVV